MVGHDRQRGPGRGEALLAVACLLLFAILAAVTQTTQAGEPRYLRIGTGPAGESYFQIGGLIAGAISSPPGTPACERGGSCGIPGVIAAALATAGSVSNVEAISDGRLDGALVQADIAAWAANGQPPFQDRTGGRLRSIANLYANQLHLVVPADSPIKSPRDLRGKRVALGVKGSGTLVHARQVLAAWAVKESDVKASYQGSAIAADRMQRGDLDAFFVVDGIPVLSIAELAKVLPITLVPLAGGGAEKLRRANSLLASTTIAAGTYQGIGETIPTLEIGVNFVVSADMPDDLAYGIAKTLWHPHTIAMLGERAPQGVGLTSSAALIGLGLPLHPGAMRFYREAGLLH
ncbi:TAXI family TRAP transporter solute-binding subunit [Telmatospirillum sp.]|uniref:TAXI family TRAP transporter solute-binding subunit n=1 Tax=Telmatospirillum sp. TaxID=2079197 RepID=UPI00284D7ED9|nr:TAXI family TRAP transporter solute-binding subunit [Telmatospirillum sp.]MDR3438554.1 TAXI family TRAP transporter solute-binding subunit [Telmatospirillum sp.]